MDTEDQILKGTKLITNIKKQRLKTQKLDSQKYNIKNMKQNQTQKMKNIYGIDFLKQGFFKERFQAIK